MATFPTHIEEIRKNPACFFCVFIWKLYNKKRRPADIDLILFVKVKEKNPKSKWLVDFPIVPDNKYGRMIFEDMKKWMKQKYGSKKSAVIRLK